MSASNRARHLALCAPDALDGDSWRERDSDIVRASVVRRHGARSRAYETCARRFGWDSRGGGGWSPREDDWRAIRREVEAVPVGMAVSKARVRAFASEEVLYEDDGVTVVAKRAGQPTTPTNRISDCESCASLVVAYWRMVRTREENVGEIPSGAVVGASLTAHACHRLDLETSGAVAFAKSAEEAKRHARAFEEKRVEKTYLALCRRRSNEVDIAPRETFSTIDVPLAKTSSSKPSSSSSFRVEARPDGKPSVTLWRILASRGEHALVQCRPETGRTHQIRAHLAHVGFPIVGDALYGARADDGEPDASVIARHALHAHVVRLDRDARAIRAPVPDDFVFACRAVGVVEDVDGFERCVMRE